MCARVCECLCVCVFVFDCVCDLSTFYLFFCAYAWKIFLSLYFLHLTDRNWIHEMILLYNFEKLRMHTPNKYGYTLKFLMIFIPGCWALHEVISPEYCTKDEGGPLKIFVIVTDFSFGPWPCSGKLVEKLSERGLWSGLWWEGRGRLLMTVTWPELDQYLTFHNLYVYSVVKL